MAKLRPLGIFLIICWFHQGRQSKFLLILDISCCRIGNYLTERNNSFKAKRSPSLISMQVRVCWTRIIRGVKCRIDNLLSLKFTYICTFILNLNEFSLSKSAWVGNLAELVANHLIQGKISQLQPQLHKQQRNILLFCFNLSSVLPLK